MTIKTSVAHNANVGDEVSVDVGRPKTKTTLTNPDVDYFDEIRQVITATPTSTTFQYQRADKKSYWYFQRNIVSKGLEYVDSPEKWTITLEVDSAHNYLVGSKVKVTGIRFPFGGEHEITDTPTSTKIQYEVDRKFKIKKRVTKNEVVFITTEKAHGFNAKDLVTITNYGTPTEDPANTGGYNGTWIVDNVLTDYEFAIRKKIEVVVTGHYEKSGDSSTTTTIYVRDSSQLKSGMYVDAPGLKRNSQITSISGNIVTVNKPSDEAIKTPSTTVTEPVAALVPVNVITVDSASGIVEGMIVNCTGIPNGTTVIGIDKKKISLSQNTNGEIPDNSKIVFRYPIRFTFKYPEKNGTDSSPPSNARVANVTEQPFEAIERSNDEIITQTNQVQVLNGGTVTLGARAYLGSYGGYAYNADIGIAVSEDGDSGVYRPIRNYVGSNLQTVGDLLEELSAGSDGFEYRIDCSFDEVSKSFSRTLVLRGYDTPDDLEPGQVRSLSSLGADKYVFEYPGSISSFSLEENAEESATRMFVTGTGEGMSGDSKQPMAAATKRSMLVDGWPLLDATEQLDQDPSTEEMYRQASSFLEESLPPIDSMAITVNGSVPPYAGTYKPGDWCSLIFDDVFMQMRLASRQEIRDNIFVRKIIGYSVEVPDAVGIPETVTLDLIRDTEVDNDGNQ